MLNHFPSCVAQPSGKKWGCCFYDFAFWLYWVIYLNILNIMDSIDLIRWNNKSDSVLAGKKKSFNRIRRFFWRGRVRPFSAIYNSVLCIWNFLFSSRPFRLGTHTLKSLRDLPNWKQISTFKNSCSLSQALFMVTEYCLGSWNAVYSVNGVKTLIYRYVTIA